MIKCAIYFSLNSSGKWSNSRASQNLKENLRSELNKRVSPKKHDFFNSPEVYPRVTVARGAPGGFHK